ncbi:hypothetical protein AM501_05300 [Aneurinibacillus migulanus]|uniref:hypothetical protein n=1 Tax=Aneurinibacillus migulanus TaxID=47500 RepID=UPI0005BE9CFF|nr:hypothetical protein [Aneurinibacillus migulanus]KIV58575.1 hypothetical protein TS64_04315 [Aneurinibacillus migulanus]KPD09253.1 hypothetical protein AM501_05300 [Aneurinibacillus migulanus]
MQLDELTLLYKEIKEKLVAPFPPGSVEFKNNNESSAYIPIQPYIHRLEEAAGVHWDWDIVGEPFIYHEENEVMVKGILRILNASRTGMGFAKFQRYPDTGKIKNLRETIRSAASDALRDACDKYEMGWVDLSKYRKWASNPGTGLSEGINDNSLPNNPIPRCIRCNDALTEEDLKMKKEYRISYNYCFKHLPRHLIRNRRG